MNEESRTRTEVEERSTDSRDYVASLARGLDVICTFTRDAPSMTLTEVAKATGMTRASTRRLLLTLVHEGYAEKSGKHFSLRPKILQLGYSALPSLSLLDVVQPFMKELSQQTGESIFIAVLTGTEVTYLARATPERPMVITISVGSRVPAYAVSTGRMLLASEPDAMVDRYLEGVELTSFTANTITSKSLLRKEISESRHLGYSLVDEEMEIGVRSLSVPIYDRSGRVTAVLNACCPSLRFTLEAMRTELVPLLKEASERITRSLIVSGNS